MRVKNKKTDLERIAVLGLAILGSGCVTENYRQNPDGSLTRTEINWGGPLSYGIASELQQHNEQMRILNERRFAEQRAREIQNNLGRVRNYIFSYWEDGFRDGQIHPDNIDGKVNCPEELVGVGRTKFYEGERVSYITALTGECPIGNQVTVTLTSRDDGTKHVYTDKINHSSNYFLKCEWTFHPGKWSIESVIEGVVGKVDFEVIPRENDK